MFSVESGTSFSREGVFAYEYSYVNKGTLVSRKKTIPLLFEIEVRKEIDEQNLRLIREAKDSEQNKKR